MILDTRTIFLITFTNVLIMGIGLLAASRAYDGPVQRSMTVWGRACLIVIAGWLLIGLREIIPSFYSVIVSNFLLHLGVAEYYQSLRLFDGQRVCRRYTNALVIVMTVALAFFFYILEDMNLRIIISSAVLMILFALSGWKLIRSPVPKGRISAMRFLVCSGFVFMFGVYLIRIVLLLHSPTALPAIIANTSLQTFVFGGTSMGFLIIIFGYLLMCNARFNADLKYLAATDYLTGLYNRRALSDLSQRELDRAKRTGEPPSFFLIDADDFKAINDQYGHEAGDAALQAISGHLRNTFRSQDLLGRFGGDEFAVLLPATTEAETMRIAERLMDSVRNTPLLFDHHKIHLSISVGTATADMGYPDFDDLIHRADQSLYAEKKRRVKDDQQGKH